MVDVENDETLFGIALLAALGEQKGEGDGIGAAAYGKADSSVGQDGSVDFQDGGIIPKWRHFGERTKAAPQGPTANTPYPFARSFASLTFVPQRALRA